MLDFQLKTESQIDAELARRRLFGEWLTVFVAFVYAVAAITAIHYAFMWAASCGGGK